MSAETQEVRLSREMRLMDVTMIGVGAMIGAGIFVLTGIAAGVAGPALIVAFALNAVISLCTAMVYAELGSCFHDAGGGYLWVKKGLPDPNGFLSGWMSWFAHAVACSLYALGFGAYFGLVLEILGWNVGHDWPISLEKILATGVVVLFCFINYRGASETGKAGNIVTVAKLIVLFVFIGFGIFAMYRNPDWTNNFSDFMARGWSGVFMAMGLTFIAFEGYEIIAQCSEEVQNPKRNIPRAIFLSLLIVVPIYLLIAWVAIGAIDGGGVPTWQYLAEKKEIAMVEAAKQFFAGGGLMIMIGGLLSTMSALNATVYSSSRVSFAMARDHNLPKRFAHLSKRHKTPHVSIFFSMGIIVAMLLWLPIEDVAAAADIMFLLLFLQVNIAFISIRKKMPNLDRGFRVPFGPVIPIVAVIGNLFIAGWLFRFSPMAWISATVWIAGGYLLHRFYAAPKETAALVQIARIEKIERMEYRVLVTLSSPKSASSLMEVGIAIAKQHGGEIVCLGVVEVPEDQPLIAGLELTGALDPLVAAGVRQAQDAGLAARGLIKVAHRISRGVVETATEEDCNFIVMGRRRTHRFFEWVYAATLESVVREAPCNVAIVAGTVRKGIVNRVLLALDADRSAGLAADLGPAMATWCDADINALTVVPTTASTEEAKKMREVAGALLKESGVDSRVAMLRSDDPVEAILRSSDTGDLIVMGGSTGGPIVQLFATPVTTELIERGKVPVVIVRKFEEKASGWFQTLLAAR